MKNLFFIMTFVLGLQTNALANEFAVGSGPLKARCEGESSNLGRLSMVIIGNYSPVPMLGRPMFVVRLLSGESVIASFGANQRTPVDSAMKGIFLVGEDNVVHLNTETSQAKIFASSISNEEIDLKCSFLNF